MNRANLLDLRASMYISFLQTKPADTLMPAYTGCLQKGFQTHSAQECLRALHRHLLPLGSHGRQALLFPSQGWTALQRCRVWQLSHTPFLAQTAEM